MSLTLYLNFNVEKMYNVNTGSALGSESFTPSKNTFNIEDKTITPLKAYTISSIKANTENKIKFVFSTAQAFISLNIYYVEGYFGPYNPIPNSFIINSQVWNTELTELTINITPNKLWDSFSQKVLFTINDSDQPPTPPPTPKKPKIIISGAIQNAVCNYTNGDEIDKNKNITIRANDGYYWDKTNYPVLLYPNEDVQSFIISNSKELLTYIIPADLQGDIELEGRYIAVRKEESYKVVLTGSITNASCNYSNGEIIDTVNKPQLIITADKGYFFTNRGYNVTINHLTHSYFNYSKTQLSLNINDFLPLTSDIKLIDNYVANKPVIKISEFNHFYELTTDELSSLAGERFVTSDSGVTDYGIYINSLFKLPFKFPTDLLGTKEAIKLGRFSTNTTATIITKDLIDFTFPTISCKEKYHNVYDYKNVKATLYPPFFQSIDLDIQYVMNCDLTVTMTLNLYSNKIAIFINSSFNNSNIYYNEINLGTDIPFVTADNKTINTKEISINPNISNSMILEITRKIPIQNNLKYKQNKIYDILNKYTGFISVDNLELSTNATSTEVDEINNLLKQGIFINHK